MNGSSKILRTRQSASLHKKIYTPSLFNGGPHSVVATGGLFITGTDTGVGKTVVTAALLAFLRNDGIDAVPMKPIQTGYKKNKNDLKFHLDFAGISVTQDEEKVMGPYRFRLAASPHLAAAAKKKKISIDKIASSFRRLKKNHEAVLVEGAGGVLVPINEKQTMLDVMKRLRLPVLVVARPALGTLNHTLLTLNELRRAKLHILGVVIVPQEPRWGKIEQNNLETIRDRGQTKVFRFPFIKKLKANES